MTLFSDAGVQLPLQIYLCYWPNDSSRIVVHGSRWLPRFQTKICLIYISRQLFCLLSFCFYYLKKKYSVGRRDAGMLSDNNLRSLAERLPRLQSNSSVLRRRRPGRQLGQLRPFQLPPSRLDGAQQLLDRASLSEFHSRTISALWRRRGHQHGQLPARPLGSRWIPRSGRLGGGGQSLLLHQPTGQLLRSATDRTGLGRRRVCRRTSRLQRPFDAHQSHCYAALVISSDSYAVHIDAGHVASSPLVVRPQRQRIPQTDDKRESVERSVERESKW